MTPRIALNALGIRSGREGAREALRRARGSRQGPASGSSSWPTAPPSTTSGRRSGSATSPRASSTPSIAPTPTVRRAARGRRRGRAHPAGLRRRLPPLGRAALAGGGRARGRERRCRGDRDLRRHDARAVARPRGVRLEYEAYEGMAEAEMERIADELRDATRRDRRRDPPSRRPGRDRRDERRDRRLRRAPRGGVRRLPRRDRHPQADRAALEEGAVRRRRGVDRPRRRTSPGRIRQEPDPAA